MLLCLPVFAGNAAQACHSTPEQRREAFDGLDIDKDGFLTVEEYYGDTGADISPEDKLKNVGEVDTDDDGKVNFDEFSAMKQKQRC
jgi:Ca2+-binding EF-hand superfamily protein